MCNYNRQKVLKTEYVTLKDLEKDIKKYKLDQAKAINNGFDYAPVFVIKPNHSKNDYDIVEMEWGFLPNYVSDRDRAKEFRNGYKKPDGSYQKGITTLNARGEELLLVNPETGKEKMFRDAALNRRCLVLSTGFFDWRHVYRRNKKTGEPLKTADKYPYFVNLKDREYFFMAGVWNPWTDRKTGEHIETVTIVTTDANKLMSQVHNAKNRMPTILDDALAWEWITGNLSEERITQIATTQYDTEKMQACTIVPKFIESDEPTTPYIYPDMPPLEQTIAKETPPTQLSLF